MVQADEPMLRNCRPVWSCDMPGPAPPPRLACRSADLQAGAADESAAVPEAAELDALELDGLELDAVELAAAPDALSLVAPDDAADGADVVDDAAQPAARSPAPSSGTTSKAFFTRAPDYSVTDDALCPL